ncbi:nose resistant to fluoxetine protein 6-like [Pectinophora gossypiella]|uniref:nose resistant to fluoxetine protein 6-like n=1 Tax=Pectinophora gossypiella TaxID=13191 RepID=UPI00214E88D5|nr:nose resistant to fluoxetine protein 6-like [Pectinophora gossypiella]
MIFFVLFILFQNSYAEITSLNESEYIRMPPLYNLDPFEPCIIQPGGVYCFVKLNLVTDEPSDLYTMMQEYSARTITHFNHTTLQYGICLPKTCSAFYQRNTTVDREVALERCLNESLWRDYKLKAKVSNNVECYTKEDSIKIDTSDITVGAVIATLLILNVIGSFLEFQKRADDCERGFFSCFSISRNWQRMVAPAGAGSEPRLTRLKGFHGLKSITMILVIMSHALLPFVLNIDNPQYIEERYNNPMFMLFTNGALVIQTFFVISGFLLAYNLQLHRETHRVSWTVLPRGALNRWLRLTPVYAVVLAVTATWLRHVGTGPLWQLLLGSESEHCRRDWWLNLLYVNNYFDDSHCMPQTWYLASDMQLYIIGLAACALTGWGRSTLLALLLLAGVLMPAAHTYFQDLDAVLIISPELPRNLFTTDATFNHTYRRGHTNLAGFVVGLATALMVYHWQKNEYKLPKIMKQRFIYWLTFPGLVAVIMLGGIFYKEGPRPSVYLRAPYAGLVRPVYAGIIGLLIVGMIFKFENVYRGILEWRGWVVPSRVSYCAYILHVAFIRLLNATRTTLVHATVPHLFEIVLSSIVISFVAAIPLHLLVEVPLQKVVKLLTGGRALSKTPGGITPCKTDGCDKGTGVVNASYV